MARGINAGGDLLTALADGTDLNKLWQDYSDAVAEYNARRGTIVNLLSFKTTLSVDAVLQTFTGNDFEDASEYGEPVGTRPTITQAELGFMFRWRDAATRFTWQFLADATKEQTDAITNSVMEADSKQVFQGVMAALFNNTARTNKEGKAVLPLWNGDSMVPPDYDGRTFGPTHTHYVTTANASLTQVSVDALMELVLEHGYGQGRNGRLVLLVNRAQANVIRGFRSTASGGSGSFDFIPGAGAPARLTTETVVGDTPPASIGDQPLIGAYGPAWVGENSLIPAGYVLCVSTGGDNSQFNPVGFREHPTTSLRGLNIVRGRVPDYPLQDALFVRGFGTGVRHRGAAAVLQVTASGTYTAPSQFVGVG
ncbi:hypothetical protein [Nocardioides pinisoli]|uniref:Phage major capsid protein n=1 Tax=Nocardioides pinisoli TaxID=2950279 RepID=A0ABT1KZE4_9ACTN|nr:hypothetical protein [Nocardioides pinisoli]MCP3422982.1 hypothetical protein [Nocardioides pinisoli]